MIVKLLTGQHLEFLCLKGGCRGSSESTHVKMSNCWKSHAAAHFYSQGAGHMVPQDKPFPALIMFNDFLLNK